jgi:succinyl-diaminopimelate desuccinylase
VPGEFIFGAVADEEVDVGVGLPYLIEEAKAIDCTDAIIPDIAGEMKEINIAEKGRLVLKVRSKGKQAHAMEPAKGVNAIHATGHFLTALEKYELRHEKHPILGGPTVNTGLIRGGAAPNAVAADCEVTLDIRYVPGQTAEKIKAEVQAFAEKVQAGGGTPGATFSTEIFQDALPCEVKPDAPIVKMILKHAPDAKITGSGGGTFAKDLILMGVEAVGWSCGNEETYHQPNEEVEVEQLTTYAGRLANLAFELCNMKA